MDALLQVVCVDIDVGGENSSIKTWMPGTRPGMTIKGTILRGPRQRAATLRMRTNKRAALTRSR